MKVQNVPKNHHSYLPEDIYIQNGKQHAGLELQTKIMRNHTSQQACFIITVIYPSCIIPLAMSGKKSAATLKNTEIKARVILHSRRIHTP